MLYKYAFIHRHMCLCVHRCTNILIMTEMNENTIAFNNYRIKF